MAVACGRVAHCAGIVYRDRAAVSAAEGCRDHDVGRQVTAGNDELIHARTTVPHDSSCSQWRLLLEGGYDACPSCSFSLPLDLDSNMQQVIAAVASTVTLHPPKHTGYPGKPHPGHPHPGHPHPPGHHGPVRVPQPR